MDAVGIYAIKTNLRGIIMQMIESHMTKPEADATNYVADTYSQSRPPRLNLVLHWKNTCLNDTDKDVTCDLAEQMSYCQNSLEKHISKN